MGTEIERKFLVRQDRLHLPPTGTRLRQGYVAEQDLTTVRVRQAGDQAWLTIKGPGRGIARPEFEYAIPVDDAAAMLDTLCGDRTLSKTRYRIPHGKHIWEVDVFHDANNGLVLAEIELDSVGESFARPDWLGDEVSGDNRYFNVRLTEHPFRTWSKSA